MKSAIIIGSGLGGLATALRLKQIGYNVTVLEKHSTAGGRLNILEGNGYKFDLGPSFMSMTYELDELFKFINRPNPIKLKELDPLYKVFFEGSNRSRTIWKNLDRLEKEFADIEPNLKNKIEKYLHRAGEFFHDTEDKVVKSNFNSKLEYVLKLSRVPFKHIPYLFKTMWSEVDKTFTSTEIKVIFSLVAFFLGSTPFQTPAIYSLLNYTEMKHNGYWMVEGGMYKMIEEIVKILKEQNVNIVYNTEIIDVEIKYNKVESLIDNSGKKWRADIIVSNSDAASFRGKILKRDKYSEKRLDKMHWTLAPFTVYLGVKGKLKNLDYHNYFLGNNFKGYADMIFTSSISPQKPYYYVNVLSKAGNEFAPEGNESVFILCPVPDLRYKQDWSDKEELADNIIKDLSARIDYDILSNIEYKKILSPVEWQNTLNLYRGSGLGLAHDIDQVGAFRPKNKDEELKNLYYVGASTTPGTGLPMVIISSKLVTERIQNEYGGV